MVQQAQNNLIRYGLIGFPLNHSFSPQYFQEKFKRENRKDCVYELFPLKKIEEFKNIQHPQGLNVTIPYKTTIIPFLDELDETAAEIGAVNCIQFKNGKSKGFNTDYLALIELFSEYQLKPDQKALIFGTGGASKAIQKALKFHQIPFKVISRDKNHDLTYDDLTKDLMTEYSILINCTPVGMFPHINEMIPIPTAFLNKNHFVFDLIYNPQKTLLLQQAEEKGCHIENGLKMLYLQAEWSWKIWNDKA